MTEIIKGKRNLAFLTIKHERGHGYQAMMMGVGTYGLMIGIPSWREWGPSGRNYYDRPWEITADIFGGVPANAYGRTGYNIPFFRWENRRDNSQYISIGKPRKNRGRFSGAKEHI